MQNIGIGRYHSFISSFRHNEDSQFFKGQQQEWGDYNNFKRKEYLSEVHLS